MVVVTVIVKGNDRWFDIDVSTQYHNPLLGEIPPLTIHTQHQELRRWLYVNIRKKTETLGPRFMLQQYQMSGMTSVL